MRYTIKDAKTALAALKRTAEKFGLDYSGFEVIRKPSGYSVENNGKHLFGARFQTAAVWYQMLQVANEALQAVERIQKQD